MQRWRIGRLVPAEQQLRSRTRLAHALASQFSSSSRGNSSSHAAVCGGLRQRMPPASRATSALHASRVLRIPFIPSVVRSAEVAAALQEAHHHTNRNAVPSSTLHELALLPMDEFVQRVHRFSRTNFSPSQRPLLYSYLKEVMKPHRLAHIGLKPLYDYLHLAHAAGMHEMCLEVYHAAREHMSPFTLSLRPKGAQKSQRESFTEVVSAATQATASSGSTSNSSTSNSSTTNLVAESAVLVSNYVVDSAFGLRSSAELTRLASYCVSQLLADTFHPARSPQETATEVSLVRCLWRAICLFEYHRCTEAGGSATPSTKGSAAQALADAEAILEGCHRVAAARRSASATAASQQHDHKHQPQRTDQLREAIHFVRYASVGDDGEFAFFQFCKERHILTSPQPIPRSATSTGGAEAPSYDIDEVQVFYGSLIETCTAGQLVPEAMQYFTEARRLLGLAPLGDEEDNSAAVMLAAAAAAPTTPTHRGVAAVAPPLPLPPTPPQSGVLGAPVTPPPPAPPAPNAPTTPFGNASSDVSSATPHIAAEGSGDGGVFTDFLIHRLLFTLQAAKDNGRTVRLGRALIATGCFEGMKANLWTMVLISAGAMRAADIALAVHDHAARQLTALGSGGAASAERRTWSYVLQTALSALSKCQLQHYERDYLQPAQEKGMMHCTNEFYYGCLLQDAHNSMNPVPRAAEVLSRMADANVPLTAPLITRLLKLYLRTESAEFLGVYKHASEQLHLRRSLWTDQLLLWADRRRYFLTAEDRAYIVDEVLRARNATDAAHVLPMLGGMRAQFALLSYDLTHNARERFLRDATLPAEAPTMQDSRAHFLTSRDLSVQRGLSAPAGAYSWVCAGEEEDGGGNAPYLANYGVLPRIVGDRPRRALHAAIAELSEVPLMLPAGGGSNAGGVTAEEEQLHDEALRVYLADVLEGLQRSLNAVA